MRRPVHFASRALSLSLLVAVPGVVVAQAAADAPACHGEPATIVGVPGQDLQGTAQPDVIVSNGAKGVFAGDGGDLICVTGDPRLVADTFASVRAGDGDDHVDTTAVDGAVGTELGPGSDTFTGGAARENVFGGVSGTAANGYRETDTDRDVIETGGGDDQVITGNAADHGAPNDDLVDLGAGNDSLILSGDAAGATLDGGTGRNRMQVATCCAHEPLLVDNRAGEIRSGEELERVVASYRGSFDRFYFYQFHPRIDFRGSGRSERLFFDDVVSHYVPPRVPFVGSLSMGGGDDRIHLPGHEFHGSIDGGPGHDMIRLASRATDRVVADLRSGITKDGRQVTRLAGMQSLTLDVYKRASVRLIGTGDRNRLEVDGSVAGARIDGRGGADHLYGGYVFSRPREPATVHGGWGNDTVAGSALSGDRLFGGRGNDSVIGYDGADRLLGGSGRDRLLGQHGNDMLLGGPGRDLGRGGPGDDRCSAVEVRRSC